MVKKSGIPQRVPARKSGSKKKRRRRKKKITLPAMPVALSAIILVTMLFLIPVLRHRHGQGVTGPPLPGMTFSSCGIDISHNNAGPIVWDSLRVMTDRTGCTTLSVGDAVRILPVRFVFIKASEGSSMKDPRFREYWTEAGKRDIRRGAYHFFRSSKDAAAQARNFISAVGELRHSDLPPVLDIETVHKGCSRETLNRKVAEWLSIMEKHYGMKPIIYTSDYFADEVLSPEITGSYPVWIAHYGVESPTWKDWEYWQFTDKARVYGVPEPVDLSIMR